MIGLNRFKRKNNKGANRELRPSSIHSNEDVSEYVGIADPIIRCRIKIINALINVATAQSSTGIRKISRKNDPLKIPVKAPISVRTRLFIPRGAAERKSRNNPEKKPETCPVIVPFT